MTVRIEGDTIFAYLRTGDTDAAIHAASNTRPFRRHFTAAVNPDRINPSYTTLLEEAEHITYSRRRLTVQEAKSLDKGIVTSDDEYDNARPDSDVAIYEHKWVFHNGYPN